MLEAYVSQLLAAQRGADEVVVAFQGGEPTMMGLDFFRRVLESRSAPCAPGRGCSTRSRPTRRSSTTSGRRSSREHDFLVGVSIDGPREMHDAFRVDKGGKPTFDRVLAGLDALKRHGVEWNALTTINAANEDHGLEVYRFLRDDLGADIRPADPHRRAGHARAARPGEQGWGIAAGERPLYRQDGDQVTHRTVGARAVRPVPDRHLRGMGPPRRR